MAHAIVPAPASVRPADGTTFALRETTAIVTADSPEVRRVGEYLAAALRPATGYGLPVTDAGPTQGAISLQLTDDAALGDEGYTLRVTSDDVTLTARRAKGLFRGVQSLRQLLPGAVESTEHQPGPWRIPGGTITDQPRFGWRGASLDVARHFFGVADVKRYIDALALYKINVLHLHLTDDQGWRVAIRSWPELTNRGGASQVGGGKGGYYTQEQYAEIVGYARDRYMTIVPEIDVPGHTNAALASYPELNCDGKAREPYTGMGVGFSSLCVDKPITYEFLDQVLGELAALTPGPYLHIGGDEVEKLTPAQYGEFVTRVVKIVESHGKRAIGWQEITGATLTPGTVVQYWQHQHAAAEIVSRAKKSGAKFVLSPGNKTYLDMKYDALTRLGLDWAGHIEVRDAYDWEPASLLDGVGESDVAGVEAPLWTETLESFDDVAFMAFPRLPAVAELGWSPRATHDWVTFRRRLALQAPRWEAMSLNYYRSPQVPWPN